MKQVGPEKKYRPRRHERPATVISAEFATNMVFRS